MIPEINNESKSATNVNEKNSKPNDCKAKYRGRVYQTSNSSSDFEENRIKIDKILELKVFLPDGIPVEGSTKSATLCKETKKKRRNTAGPFPVSVGLKRSLRTTGSVTFKPRISEMSIMRGHCLMYLRSIHEALIDTPTLAEGEMCWKDNFGLYISRKGTGTSQGNKKVFGKIVETLNRALNLDMDFFYNRYGGRVGLEKVLTLFSHAVRGVKAFNAPYYTSQLTLLEKTIAFMMKKNKEVVEKKAKSFVPLQLMVLPFPIKPKRAIVAESDSLCLKLLQRLYSVETSTETMKAGAIHPMTLLCTYRKMFSTQTLFTQIRRALQLPLRFMPIQQKVEVLNLCRMWITSGLNSRERGDEEVRRLLMSVVVQGNSLHSKRLRELSEEIYLLLHYPFDDTPNISLVAGSLEIEKTISSNVELRSSSKGYREAIELYRNELHLCSAYLFLSFDAHEPLYGLGNKDSSVKAPNLSKLPYFFNKLTSFAVTTILQPVNEFVTNEKGKKKDVSKVLDRVRQRYLFFLDLSCELYKMNDLPTACALFGALSTSSVSRLFIKHLNFNTSEGKLVSKDKRIDKKITKSAMEKLRRLSKTFTPAGSFAELRKIIKEFEDKSEIYIPFMGIALGDIPHIDDGNKDFIELPILVRKEKSLNVEKFDLFAKVIVSVLRAQRRLFNEMLSNGPLGSFQTNLFSFIQECEVFDEEKNYRLSTTLKPQSKKK